jgi:betaine-aldehyde dehydrogenase
MSTYTVVNPATAQAVTEVEQADLAATDEAIQRAH